MIELQRLAREHRVNRWLDFSPCLSPSPVRKEDFLRMIYSKFCKFVKVCFSPLETNTTELLSSRQLQTGLFLALSASKHLKQHCNLSFYSEKGLRGALRSRRHEMG